MLCRFFVLLSGLAKVSLPYGDDELWIMEGVNGLMIAADTKGDGHVTEYPSDKPSVALQIPFAGGRMPKHLVVGKGVCDPITSWSSRIVQRDGRQSLQVPM